MKGPYEMSHKEIKMKTTCPLCGSKNAEDWAVSIKCPTEKCKNAYKPLIDEIKASSSKKTKRLKLELEIEELERQIDPLLINPYYATGAIDYHPVDDPD